MSDRPVVSSPVVAGLAASAEWLSAVAIVSLAGTIYAIGYDGLAYGLGFMAGLLVVAALMAPEVRAAGAISIPGYFQQRFGGFVAPLAALVLVACLVMVLAAQLLAAAPAVGALTGLDRTGAMGAMAAASLVVVTLRRVWPAQTLVAITAVLIAAAVMTVAGAMSWELYGLPVAQLTYGTAVQSLTEAEQRLLVERLADARTLKPHVQPFVTFDILNFFGLVLGLTIGTAVLFPGYSTLGSSKPGHATRLAGAWMLLVVGLVVITAPALAAFAKLSVYETVAGRSFADAPAWLYEANAKGLVTICGKQAPDIEAARAACGTSHPGRIRLQDIGVDPDAFALSMPSVPPVVPHALLLFAAVVGLAGIIAGAAMARSVGAAVSIKLSVNTRTPMWHLLGALMALVSAWALAIVKPGDALTLIGWASALGAAALGPAMLAGLVWSRANAWGAGAAIIAGGGVTFYYLAGTMLFAPAFFETWRDMSVASPVAALKVDAAARAWAAAAAGPAKDAAWVALDTQARAVANWFGVKPGAAALFGLPCGLAAVWLVSLVSPRRSSLPRGG